MLHGTVHRIEFTKDANNFLNDYYEITGAPYLVRDWIRRIHPAHLRRVIRCYVRAMVSGKVYEEYPILCADGEYRWIRAQGLRLGVDWVGTLDLIERGDAEHFCSGGRCACNIGFAG